jgi:hypothetical protein
VLCPSPDATRYVAFFPVDPRGQGEKRGTSCAPGGFCATNEISDRGKWLYNVLGLFNGYRVRRYEPLPKVVPAR